MGCLMSSMSCDTEDSTLKCPFGSCSNKFCKCRCKKADREKDIEEIASRVAARIMAGAAKIECECKKSGAQIEH